MHAHLRRTSADRGSAATADALADWLLSPVDGGPPWQLTVWEEPPPEGDGATTGRYAVEDLSSTPGAGTSAAFAALTQFDGPRSAAQVAADQRSGRERVWPAAAAVPGVLAALALRADDGALVVVALAESEAALEAAGRAIMSTPLLPGEDPALLGGPTRQTVCRAAGTGLDRLLQAGAGAAVTS